LRTWSGVYLPVFRIIHGHFPSSFHIASYSLESCSCSVCGRGICDIWRFHAGGFRCAAGSAVVLAILSPTSLTSLTGWMQCSNPSAKAKWIKQPSRSLVPFSLVRPGPDLKYIRSIFVFVYSVLRVCLRFEFCCSSKVFVCLYICTAAGQGALLA
jgi:hypothetical protein